MESDREHGREIVGIRGCDKEIGGSCEEVSNDATDIEDDGGRNQVRDGDSDEEMEDSDADRNL